MFCSILGSIFRKNLQAGLLLLGLLAITAGIALIGAASETTGVVATQDLRNYWRTTYDILVRPANSHSPIEEQFGLVEANHLSGIAGGITLSQYEAIKSIPGVQVAAPIAMLGYVTEIFEIDMGRLSDPGAFIITQTVMIDDGARVYNQPRYTYYYVATNVPSTSPDFATQTGIIVAPSIPAIGYLEIPLFLAGIDPPEEAKLIRVDGTLTEGKYLTGNEPLNPRPAPSFLKTSLPRIDVPALINTTPYVSMTLYAELKQLVLPATTSTLEAIVAKGGAEYLASLPGQRLAFQETQSEAAYQQLIEGLHRANIIHQFATSTPGRIIYQQITPPFPHDGLVLEIVMPGRQAPLGIGPAYRHTADPRDAEARFGAPFTLNVVGAFDLERLPKPADVNRVPLETYYPPLAILRYDEAGNPVEPRTLRPTLNPAGYLQSPPLILTTLAAARALRGDDCISAIRVRVDGIEEMTPAAQRKIEAIASEIVRRTGLTVDVMVGSSPRRVLVHVPGIGYVEEQWIHKGVNVVYQRQIQSGHWVLMGVVIVIGGLFTLDLAWAEVVARRRTLALQKALGWRSSTVCQHILGQAFWIGLVAGATGTLLAWASALVFGWSVPSLNWLVGVPLFTMSLCVVGSLYPAWQAMHLPPISVIQTDTVHSGRIPVLKLDAVWHYAWRSLVRRRNRAVLTGLAMLLSSTLLVILLAANLERQGLLAGTLLGEYILVHIEAYHYALVALGFGLATVLMANNLLTSVLERRREIGILKAIGWRTTAVARLFVVEGMWLGIVSGAIGTLLGIGVFLWLYRTALSEVVPVAWLGILVPLLLGVLAALYPAWVAARVPPAEAVRYE